MFLKQFIYLRGTTFIHIFDVYTYICVCICVYVYMIHLYICILNYVLA